MNRFELIILTLLFISTNIFSQEKDISDLESLKSKLTNKIKTLKDSSDKINSRIKLLQTDSFTKIVSDSSFSAFSKKGAYVKNKPSILGDIVTKLKEKKKVVVTDYNNDYFKIHTGSVRGYLNSIWLHKSNKVLKLIKAEKEIQKQEKKLKRVKKQLELEEVKVEKAKLDIKYTKKYGSKTYKKLKKGYYWIGMTKDMAIISLGKPTDINKTVGSWGVHEQWVYYNIYLYFENGKLTSYQN